ncbi:heterokaryon incompatibility protein-domain-containing protein [Dactylonectria macrodidyma]|uniref:Heterokaryon incompatibility protein-domain-containing protein n=1 Tax=Dactylonectria macrodidyma TaxID=307937 RepID=A0A9P9JS03_9HYPO|nr:heterokaryon incompatibility protein-domain-containing protein [Dactylonectria macrodidyma]
MAALRYEPLSTSDDEIRILDLLPGLGPISCRLRNVKLSDHPQYEALSYCWGTSAKKRVISINDHPVPIGINLYSALQHLRTNEHPRSFWVDATCINQEDAAEKNVQIPLMGKIYAQCSRAVIWLGPSDVLTRRAFRALKVLLEYSHIWPLGNFLVSIHCWRHAERNLGQTTGRTPQSDKNLNQNWFWDRIFDSLAFFFLWRKPWFSRVWVLQEATVCPDAIVKCGDDEINWTRFIHYWNHNEELDVPSGSQGPLVARLGWKREVPMDLFDAFAMNEDSLATNPRDKIYGVLAFVKYNDYIKIDVDYAKDPADIYLEFSTATLKARSDLDMLTRSCGDRLCDGQRLPSWSLSWDISQDQQLYGLTFSIQSKGRDPKPPSPDDVRATGDSKPHVSFSKDGKLLGLLGMRFDEITFVGEPSPQSHVWQRIQMFKAYLSWRNICDLDSPTDYEPTGQSRREVFWRTMKWFRLLTGYANVEEENEQLAAFDKTFMKLTTLLPQYLFGIQIGIILLIVWDLWLEFAFTTGFYTTSPSWFFDATAGWGRNMAKTSNGFVALGPSTLRPGDVIFLVSGSKAPLTFRQYGDRWRVVGETYIHGIMSGQVFDSSKCEEMWVE